MLEKHLSQQQGEKKHEQHSYQYVGEIGHTHKRSI
jgi:hypothetical protein